MRDKKVSKDRLFKILSRISDQKQKNKERNRKLLIQTLSGMSNEQDKIDHIMEWYGCEVVDDKVVSVRVLMDFDYVKDEVFECFMFDESEKVFYEDHFRNETFSVDVSDIGISVQDVLNNSPTSPKTKERDESLVRKIEEVWNKKVEEDLHINTFYDDDLLYIFYLNEYIILNSNLCDYFETELSGWAGMNSL